MKKSDENVRESSKIEITKIISPLKKALAENKYNLLNAHLSLILKKLNYSKDIDECLQVLFKITTILWSYEQIDHVQNIINKIDTILATDSSQNSKYYKEYLAELNFMKGCIFTCNSSFKLAQTHFSEALQQTNKKEFQGHLFEHMGVLEMVKSNFSKALKWLNKSYSIFKEIDLPLYESFCYNNIGIIKIIEGDRDAALSNFQKAADIRENLNHPITLFIALNNIGEIYRLSGENDTALAYYQKALGFLESFNTENENIIPILSGLEWMLEYSTHSTIPFVTIIRKYGKTAIKLNIGLVYHSMERFEDAFKFLKQAYEYEYEKGFSRHLTLFHLIYLTTDMEKMEEANYYFKELQTIQENHTISEEGDAISQFLLISKGLILRKRENLKSFTEYVAILEKLYEKNFILFDIKRFVLLFLMEAYLKELILFENEALFKKTEKIVAEIEKLAINEKSILLRVNVYYIKAKMAEIKLDFQKARELLELGYDYAERNQLWSYAGKIYSDLQNLESRSHIHALKLRDRIKKTQIETVIKDITKNKSENITHFPEFGKKNIKVALFQMKDEGPVPVQYDVLDFGDENSVILKKLALFYVIALGQGNTPNYGFYGPLPIPDKPGYIALAYSFLIANQEIRDPRMQGNSFTILSFVMPEPFVKFFKNRDEIHQELSNLLSPYQDIDEITLKILHSIKAKILH